MSQNRIRLGLRPTPLVGIKGPTSKGNGEVGMGKGRGRGEPRRRKGRRGRGERKGKRKGVEGPMCVSLNFP